MSQEQTKRRDISRIGWFVLWSVIGSACFYAGIRWIDQLCYCPSNEVIFMFTCAAIPMAGLSAGATGTALYASLRKLTQWKGQRLVITASLALLTGVAGLSSFAAFANCRRCGPPGALPADCPPDCQGLTLPNAWFLELDLSNADLSNSDLRNADLHYGNLQGADLTDANLHGAVLTSVNLQAAQMPGVVLTEAHLNGAKMHGADLTGANLSRANLFRADLTGANLTGADLRGAILSETQYNDETTWPDGFSPVRAGAIHSESD